MTIDHGKEVMTIFNYYVEHSYAAYFENKLPDSFFSMFIEMTKGYPAYVIKDNATDKVIGFCFLKPYNPLPVFKHTAEITYFITKDDVGKGIGKAALKLLIDEGKAMGIKQILASISSLNEPSIAFHRRNGFRECGRFLKIGKKNENLFDVVWMEKEISQ
ncbi:N-acetyltransferase family protein [Dehalobacter sp. DCM]|uniref:GNAT family N-acetyltransferase n=1 Tax=Dehalobacter sp. DCM TaxID=2907827 RepID=UPI003081F9F4|nr:N-acetyltransferase family protein [Dehalobacter sp. DCM]